MNAAAWGPSPRRLARIAGVFYALNIATGSLALVLGSKGLGRAANLVATADYAAVTLLLYVLLKPVSVRLSALAALAGLAGCAAGAYGLLAGTRAPIHPLALFGVYCLLVGWLIVRSSFLPRVLGVCVMIGGLGWLTFASRSLGRQWTPYNMAPGILAESALTIWLLAVGLNQQAWIEAASRSATKRGYAAPGLARR